MPHQADPNPVVWTTLGDDGFDEIQHFNCPWTITSNNDSITVTITYLKWTSSYDFWIREEIHPRWNPTISKFLENRRTSPFVQICTMALLNYYKFPEPHLNEFQLHVYGKLMDHLSYKVG